MKNRKDRLQYLIVAVLMVELAMVGIPGVVQAANFGGPTDNGTANYMTANWMGIGTTSPTKILHVTGTGPGTVPLFQRGSDSAGFIIERTATNRWVLGVNEAANLGNGFVLSTIPTGTTSIPRLLVMQDGRVGINTVTPYAGAKLHVYSDNATSQARAIYGETLSGDTAGVAGQHTTNHYLGALGGPSWGVVGQNNNNNNAGQLGTNNYGVWGQGSAGSTGIYGESSTGNGVHGVSTTSGNFGYLGTSVNGAYGQHNSTGNYGSLGDAGDGVFGHGAGGSQGVYGTSSTGSGVYGISDDGTGVRGINSYNGGTGVSGSGTGSGVSGTSVSGYGVMGTSTSGTGIYGASTSGEAGHFLGRAVISDNLSIGTTSAPNSTLQVTGSFATAYTSVSGNNYSATKSDCIIGVSAPPSTTTVTLPSAVGIPGRYYTVKSLNANTVNIATVLSQHIDNGTSLQFTSAWKYVTVVSNGSDWLIVANN